MKTNKYKSYINHSRYGKVPMNNGYKYSLEEVHNSFWLYSYVTVFPKSAIPADISKQKYWYEVLGFYIDVDCVKCIECRKAEQKIKEKALRYEELIKKKNRTNREIKDLKYVAYALYEIGYLKNKSKMAQILKLKEVQ